MNVSLSLMYPFLNLFKELACTDRLNLHDFSIDWKASVEGEADAYGWWHCGCVVSAFRCLISAGISLSMSSTSSINAANL